MCEHPAVIINPCWTTEVKCGKGWSTDTKLKKIFFAVSSKFRRQNPEQICIYIFLQEDLVADRKKDTKRGKSLGENATFVYCIGLKKVGVEAEIQE